MGKSKLFILLACLVSTLSLSANEAYKMNYDKETRGVVRKMQIYKYPLWVSKVITKDSQELYFSSPKSMLEFYYNPHKWPEVKINDKSQLKDIVVTDFITGKAIDAKYAFYIYGSNKISVAGDDLPTFENIHQAKNFMKKHNGKRILNFNELSNGLIQLLNGDI